MIELRDILRGLREQKQVSMDKMCEDLNVLYNVTLAKSTISKWENGKAEPSLAYARILTKYFNVTLDYLLGLEKEEFYTFNTVSKSETLLLCNFNKLNSLGKEKLIEYSNDLIDTPKYIEEEKIKNNVTELITSTTNKFNEKPHLIPKASHDKKGTFTTEEYKHDDDLMNDDDFWKK
jgi:Predicted transcriptional regulators